MSFEADEVRGLVKCLYSAIDRQDWSTLEAVVSQRVVVEVGGGAPVGWTEWLGRLQEFFTAFPDGRHELDEVLVDGSHGVSRCRFVGTHTGEFVALRRPAPRCRYPVFTSTASRRHAGHPPRPARHAPALRAARSRLTRHRQYDTCYDVRVMSP